MDRIDALRLLLDVADMGSFSSVSRQRTVAVSTVALAVSQLEQEFGTRLMTSSTRKLVLTHEGETLLQDARRIVSDWDAAISGQTENGPLSGPVRVTSTNDFGRNQLRPWLDAFQDLHPGVHISLLLSDNAVDLLQEQIDLAIRSGPLPDSNLLAKLLIRGDRLVCASPDYWRTRGKPAHPAELKDHNCLILARPGAPLSPWPFRSEGKAFNVRVSGNRQTSDGDILRHWAVEGRGVIIKNHWDILGDIEAGRLETVLESFVAGPTDLFLVQPSGPSSRRVVALAEFLSKVIVKPPPPPAGA